MGNREDRMVNKGGFCNRNVYVSYRSQVVNLEKPNSPHDIVLFTILFFTLRFPKSIATPDLGVGGFERPAATSADPENEIATQ